MDRRDFLRTGAVWLGGLRVADLVAGVPASAGGGFVPAAATVRNGDDLAYLTVAQAARMIAAGEVTPLDLVDACLARIGAHEDAIKAWVYLRDAEEVRAEARAAGAEIAASGPRSPLHGIPIGHKDLYDVEGIPTRAGSAVLADAPPAARDATAVRRLRRAGAIVLGKTNTHEFAYGVWSPPTSNPWNTGRIPGGSSGGSGAALASGMCLAATGSDTGGSIRIPSSLCGTVGLKPTFGRVPKDGVVPLAWSLDHAGPMTRAVEDCALILNLLAGADPADPTSVGAPVPDFTGALGSAVAGMRVGVPTTVFFEGADPEAAALVRAAAAVLASLGVEIVELAVPATQRIAGTAYLVIQLSEPLAAHEHFLRDRAHRYQPQTQVLFGLGAPWTAQHYLRAQRIRTINIREWVEIFGGIDAVLTPTVPRPAPTKEEAQASGVFDMVNYTSFFDLNGCPSISVPAGNTAAGLPVGVMLSARPFGETRLLGLAHAYQEATGFNSARPPLG